MPIHVTNVFHLEQQSQLYFDNFKTLTNCKITVYKVTSLAQIIDPETGGRSRTLLIFDALLWGYWTLNLSWRVSISSFTSPINNFWYSLIAPLILGRTNNALNLENILNISFAFFAVPSWSLRVDVILVSTRSILSP